MKDNASREEISYRERQVPHPVLDRYYASERDRRPFVLDLFDGAASNYDLVCALLSLGSGQSYRRAALGILHQSLRTPLVGARAGCAGLAVSGVRQES